MILATRCRSEGLDEKRPIIEALQRPADMTNADVPIGASTLMQRSECQFRRRRHSPLFGQPLLGYGDLGYLGKYDEAVAFGYFPGNGVAGSSIAFHETTRTI